MIALLFALALAGQPAEALPPELTTREPTEQLTRPEPRVLGVDDTEAAPALIAGFTPLLRDKPAVTQAFLVIVDYGPPDGRRRVLVVDGPQDNALGEKLLDVFGVHGVPGETLDVVFLKPAQIERVAGRARPFYKRAG